MAQQLSTLVDLQIYEPSMHEAGAGGSGVEGHLWLRENGLKKQNNKKR